jgi:hypothetical protein
MTGGRGGGGRGAGAGGRGAGPGGAGGGGGQGRGGQQGPPLVPIFKVMTPTPMSLRMIN